MMYHGASCSQISHYRPAERMLGKEFHSQIFHAVSSKMLNTGKGNMVHLGRNNPRHQCMLLIWKASLQNRTYGSWGTQC